MPTKSVRSQGKDLSVFLLVLVGGLIAGARADGQADPALERYNVQSKPLDLLPPGTVVEKTAPAPYTHLIVKSHPRLGAGDLHAANAMMKELAAFLHTSLLAKVAPHDVNGEQRYRLEQVATGFGTNIRGRGDTIISPDTQQKLGANLGFMARIVLEKCHSEQQKCRYVVRSDTMAIVDTPVIMLRNGKHRQLIIRYAFLVSERSGRLDTLLWMIDLDDQGRYAGLAGELHWLAPGKIVDCVMHVDSDEFTLGIPSDKAFACVSPPQGEAAIPIPEGFAPLAVLPQFTPEQAKGAEVWLWNVLQKLAASR